MDAIILAGGKGSRLKKIVSNVPKPLAAINNIPFLNLLISEIEKQKETNNIILSVGYKKEKIIQRYKKKKNILFSEENYPLGTGGAIKKALTLTKTENVLILNGDTYQKFYIKNLLKFHIDNLSDITIVIRKEKNKNLYGNIILDKNTHKIISFCEKKNIEKSFINAGIYIFKKNILKNFTNDIFSIETDFFPKILNEKKITGFLIEDPLFIDIGTKKTYFQAQKLLKNV